MDFFVNLPLSWVHNNDTWLKLLFESHLNPELGLDAASIDLPAAWHKNTARRIAGEGLRNSAHLPFFMPPPGAVSRRQREKSADILCRAAEIAAIYQAVHMVGHPAFRTTENSALCEPGAGETQAVEAIRHGFLSRPAKKWLEDSAATWKKVLQICESRLFLENTHEDDPVPVARLLEQMRSELGMKEAGHVAMCFDIGHWHCFANGHKKHDLEHWIEYAAPYIGHLHLHDNNGGGDQHLGLGCGGIPLERFFELLKEYRLSPSFTLEPHDLESLASSLAWAGANPTFKAWHLSARRLF